MIGLRFEVLKKCMIKGIVYDKFEMDSRCVFDV